MSKIEDLLMRKDGAVQDYDETLVKCKAEETEINDEIEKLEKEFERKIKALFRGVIANVTATKERLIVFIGTTPQDFFGFGFLSPSLGPDTTLNDSSVTKLVAYTSSTWTFDDKFITRATADKIKALYIEYYGEL